SERVWTPRLAIALQKRVFVGFNEDQSNRVVLLEMFQEWRQFFKLQSFARVHQQGRPREVAFTGSVEFSKDWNEVHGQVIHAVESHVFKRAENSALAGTGKAGKNDELAGILLRSRGGLHGRAAQLFTRR